MQLFALDKSGMLVFAKQAKKKIDYTCMECGDVVRLREGVVRQPHFYHLSRSSNCQQHSKSLAHIQLQLFFQSQLPNAQLEVRFPSINRIADVVWEKEKIVIEIQCSFMSKVEMLSRVKDYHSAGYQILWILHDRRFNQWRKTAMEHALEKIPHYFTNMTSEGKGMIYDQWQWEEKGIRKKRLPPLPVDASSLYRTNTINFRCWPFGFKGDLVSLEADHPYRMQAYEFEEQLKKRSNQLQEWKENVFILLTRLFQSLLKPYCVKSDS